MKLNRILWIIIPIIFSLPGLFVGYQALRPFETGPLILFSSTVLGTYVSNTFLLVLITCSLSLMIGGGLSTLVIFYDFKGKRFFESALCLPFVLPSYIVAIVYKEISHSHRAFWTVENLWGAGLIFAFTLYPYAYMLLKAAYQHQALSYIEAGKSLGLNRFKLIKKILFPMALPAVFLGLLLVFMEVFSDYGTANVLGVRTLTVGIYDIWFAMYNPKLAAQVSLLMIAIPLVAVIMFLFYTKKMGFYNPANRPRLTKASGLKGAAAATAFLACMVPLIFGFIIPVAILVRWSVDALQKADLTTLYSDIYHTLFLACLVTVSCIVLALFFAYLKRVNKNSLIRPVIWAVNLNYTLPAIVIAIALLFMTGSIYQTVIGRWISNTVFFLVFACVIRYVCFAYFSVESGMQRISLKLDEAAYSIKKGPLFNLFHIHLPLIKRSVIVGGVIVFINITKELTMSLVLQPFNYSSLAIRTFAYAGIDMLKESSIYALTLIVICIYPLFSVSRWFETQKKE